jgi:SpoVK/Ycf46/Vps4 family AAA+-type ATPase
LDDSSDSEAEHGENAEEPLEDEEEPVEPESVNGFGEENNAEEPNQVNEEQEDNAEQVQTPEEEEFVPPSHEDLSGDFASSFPLESSDERFASGYSLRRRKKRSDNAINLRPRRRILRNSAASQVTESSRERARNHGKLQRKPPVRTRAVRSKFRVMSDSESGSMSNHIGNHLPKRHLDESEKLLPINWRDAGVYNIDPDESALLSRHKDATKQRADIQPLVIDKSIDWNEVGGLDGHIRALKEMVLLPLMYPEVFDKYGIQPPRGVLFFGPPGTGKTLTARALASTCSSSGKKVSFFMRKGADCLSKWIGEAERQLRLLFEEAQKQQPAIIFFDEIDGLAPVRSSRQDQIHSSIVSTLLALMDGLDSRGQVIVIGATNRIDAIDPALRRPGRFDRELMFSLPSRSARRTILGIHTKKWTPPISRETLDHLADMTVGYCGADLRALCTEASLCSIRRLYPSIYSSTQRLQLNLETLTVHVQDFQSAFEKVVPASRRSVVTHASPLPHHLNALLGEHLQRLIAEVKEFFSPRILTSQQEDLGSHSTSWPLSRPRFLVHGEKDRGQSIVVNALLEELEDVPLFSIDLGTILSDTISKSPDEACVRILLEAKRRAPSILFWPNVDVWWDVGSEALKQAILTIITQSSSEAPILILAYSDTLSDVNDLSADLRSLFSSISSKLFNIRSFSLEQRSRYFLDIFHSLGSVSDIIDTGHSAALPVPEAIPSEAFQNQSQDALVSAHDEEILLRLRVRLRALINRLMEEFNVIPLILSTHILDVLLSSSGH